MAEKNSFLVLIIASIGIVLNVNLFGGKIANKSLALDVFHSNKSLQSILHSKRTNYPLNEMVSSKIPQTYATIKNEPWRKGLL